MQFDIKTRDFLNENLFKPSKKPNFEKVVLQDKSSGVYYVLIIIVNSLVIAEDICLMISSSSANKIPPLNFRLWLNATYVEPTYEVKSLNDININRFVGLTQEQRSCEPLMLASDNYLKLVDTKKYSDV